MQLRFLNPETIFKGVLSSFKGTFNEMWVPHDDAKEEKYCYISFNNESEIVMFVNHFNTSVGDLETEEEYPSNRQNAINGRMLKFTKIMPK